MVCKTLLAWCTGVLALPDTQPAIDTLLYVCMCVYVHGSNVCLTEQTEEKLAAEVMTSSSNCTITGIFLQPGDLSTLMSSFIVSWSTLGGHMSILVTTTKTGTLRARASPRCSLVIPTIPALDPIYRGKWTSIIQLQAHSNVQCCFLIYMYE